MNCNASVVVDNTPEPVRSKALSWAAGATGQDFPLDVLFSELKRKVNPLVTEVHFRFFGGSLTTAAGVTATARLFPQIFDRVQLLDKPGVIIDLKGSELRAVIQQEQGQGYSDVTVSGQGNIAAATTVTSFEIIVPFTFQPNKAKRRADSRIRVQDLYDNGAKLLIDFAAAVVGPSGNQFTINSGTYEVIWWIIDEGNMPNGDPGQRTRYEWRAYTIFTDRMTFPVRGRLRYALQYIGQVGENKGTSDTWASMNLNIPALQYLSRPTTFWIQKYFEESFIRHADPAGTVAAEDMVRAGTLIPISPPEQRQALTERAELTSLYWETSVTFGTGTFNSTNTPRMIICMAVDRAGCAAPSHNITAEGGPGALVPSAQVADSLKTKLPGTTNPTVGPGA